jgi:carboxyl-terminal processing protease
MKKGFQKNGILLLLLAGIFVGCSKSQDPTPTATSTTTTTTTTPSTSYSSINNWIYSVMNDAYFWNSNMPALSTLDATASPTDFFEKLIYQRSTTDRFSDITSDIVALQQDFNGVSKIFGIRYMIGYTDSGNSNVGLFLSAITKGSPAEAAGLKRGDFVMKINGQQLTDKNLETLLGGSDTQTFTLGTISNGAFVADDSKNITMTRAVVAEDPVLFSSVIDKSASGKKIGYLVYTQFVPGLDIGDTLKYDNELRQAFANFKNQGVNELVLDLRFNPGGYVSSSVTLASLIVKNLSTQSVFYKDQYNSQYQTYFQSRYGLSYFNNYFQAENNNIGGNLSRVFVLTSDGTASASELIINGLKPYMDVITIGDHTYGKNLFGTLVSDDQKRWNWGMYIMLGQTANANGQSDYGNVNGIAPTYQVSDNVVPFRAFGDENETLLNKALLTMGVQTTPIAQNARISSSLNVERFSKEHFSDNPKFNEKRMLVKHFPALQKGL